MKNTKLITLKLNTLEQALKDNNRLSPLPNETSSEYREKIYIQKKELEIEAFKKLKDIKKGNKEEFKKDYNCLMSFILGHKKGHNLFN